MCRESACAVPASTNTRYVLSAPVFDAPDRRPPNTEKSGVPLVRDENTEILLKIGKDPVIWPSNGTIATKKRNFGCRDPPCCEYCTLWSVGWNGSLSNAIFLAVASISKCNGFLGSGFRVGPSARECDLAPTVDHFPYARVLRHPSTQPYSTSTAPDDFITSFLLSKTPKQSVTFLLSCLYLCVHFFRRMAFSVVAILAAVASMLTTATQALRVTAPSEGLTVVADR